MNTGKRYYRRSTHKNRNWKKRQRKQRTHAKHYGTQAKKPILGDGFWDDIFKFERKWGVMRRGREWPKH